MFLEIECLYPNNSLSYHFLWCTCMNFIHKCKVTHLLYLGHTYNNFPERLVQVCTPEPLEGDEGGDLGMLFLPCGDSGIVCGFSLISALLSFS